MGKGEVHNSIKYQV